MPEYSILFGVYGLRFVKALTQLDIKNSEFARVYWSVAE